MNEISAEIKINKVESSSKYLLQIGDNNYYIGELIKFIITQLMQKKSCKEISALINNEYNPENLFTEQIVNEIINNQIKNLGVFNKESLNKQNSSIKAKITLLGEKSLLILCYPFKFLFNPTLFVILFSVAIITNVCFFVFKSNIAINTNFNNIDYNIWYFILFYPLLITIFLVHELGHASATLNFKIIPKSIGFGFYFLIPVLYTDVSNIWALSRHKRIIVNLAGIYIQLLINIVLIFIYSIISVPLIKSLFIYIIFINVTTLFLNLIPFVKYDAYWIYSDLMNIPNLKIKSRDFLYEVFVNILKIKKTPFSNYSISLIVYSILSLLFFIWLYYKILIRFYYELVQIEITWKIIQNIEFISNNITYILITFLTYIFGFAILYSFFRIINRVIKLL